VLQLIKPCSSNIAKLGVVSIRTGCVGSDDGMVLETTLLANRLTFQVYDSESRRIRTIHVEYMQPTASSI